MPGQHQLHRGDRRPKESCELWDELEECVSGFNVQIINQASHLIIWLTNLNAWYGRAVDGISTVSLAGATTKYHGWNYEFSMTQTIPRLMSFPTERTENLLRFETGQAVGERDRRRRRRSASATCLIAFGRKPGGVEKAFGLPPHYRFTWGQAVGYPLEGPNAGGQRPRLKFERLFHDNAYGMPARVRPARRRDAPGEGPHPGAGAAPRPLRGDRRRRARAPPRPRRRWPKRLP